jgi:hypothetical protein
MAVVMGKASREGSRKPELMEPELMGAAEAADELGVRQQNLRTVAGLPAPYGRVRATTLWRADEIRRLAKRRGARTDRRDDVQE